MERHSFHGVLGDLPETLRKLCLSTKFPRQEIKRNFVVLRSDHYYKFLHCYKSSRQEVFYKSGVLKNLQNSQENTRVRVSYLIDLQVGGLQLHKQRDSGTGVSL